MNSCNAEEGHEVWSTKLVFKKIGDVDCDGHVCHGDEVGIFSAETGQRLDAGTATCEVEFESWATLFEIRLEGGKSTT